MSGLSFNRLGSKLTALLKEALIIGIGAACVKAGYFAVSKWSNPNSAASKAAMNSSVIAAVGRSIGIKGFESGRHKVTVLFVTSPQCKYCLRSAEFHASILRAAQQGGIPVYVAVPDVAAARPYLESAHLNSAVIRAWRDVDLKVRGTPTVILADSDGIIRRIWTGELDTDEQERVLGIVRNPAALSVLPPRSDRKSPTSPRQLSKAEYDKAEAAESATLLDIRERDETVGIRAGIATQIPLSELAVRARFELESSKLIAIDCSQVLEQSCDMAAKMLVDQGFEAATLNSGAFVNLCKSTKL